MFTPTVIFIFFVSDHLLETLSFKVSGFYCGFEDFNLQRCYAMSVATFQWLVMPSLSGSPGLLEDKVETLQYSEAWVTVSQLTWHCVPEDLNLCVGFAILRIVSAA